MKVLCMHSQRPTLCCALCHTTTAIMYPDGMQPYPVPMNVLYPHCKFLPLCVSVSQPINKRKELEQVQSKIEKLLNVNAVMEEKCCCCHKW